MIYDPKWEQQTKTPSLAGFIAWLEQQPANGKYNWGSCNCAVHQYLRAIGADEGSDHNYRAALEHGYGAGGLVVDYPWTFGAALERARELAAA